MSQKTIETILSPELSHQVEMKGKTVVVIDVLRATTCMVTAFMAGADHLLTFSDVEECRKSRSEGYLLAGERNGKKIDDFDLGNSPNDYLNLGVNGKKISITTTNGTQAIESSKDAEKILIGSFLNFSALVEKCQELNNPLVLYCAGWKGRVNLEDSLLAGAIIERAGGSFELLDDSSYLAVEFYQKEKDDLIGILQNASHYKRLSGLSQSNDLETCVSMDKTIIVPEVKGNRIEA